MPFTLDLSGYGPYKTMGQSCEMKDIREFHVNWPELAGTNNFSNSDLRMRYMCAEDIQGVVELWKDVYPEAYGSTHQFVFDPQWYEGNVLMDKNRETDAMKKPYAIILLDDLGRHRLCGILLLTKRDQNLQVEFTMGGLHSGFRRTDIFYPFFKNILDSMSKTEAELITVFAETWHKKTQELMEYHGFKIWGIFPGNMIRWSRDQKCYRACEVHYYKFINDGERFASGLDEWVLSEKAKEVWRALESVNV